MNPPALAPRSYCPVAMLVHEVDLGKSVRNENTRKTGFSLAKVHVCRFPCSFSLQSFGDREAAPELGFNAIYPKDKTKQVAESRTC